MPKRRRPPTPERPHLSELPQWEKELRLLFGLAHLLMRPMTPPTAIVDTSELPEVFQQRWEQIRSSPQFHRPSVDPASHQPFLDPDAEKIHPYVRETYIAPLSSAFTQGLPSITPESNEKLLRVFPAILVSPEAFVRGGLFLCPYESAAALIEEGGESIRSKLADWRNPKPVGEETPEEATLKVQEVFEKTVRELEDRRELRFPPRLWLELGGLAGKGIDVAQVYGTLVYSGNALLQALSFYRELEDRRKKLRGAIRKDKQSLRSHLSYWQARLRPHAFDELRAEVKEILDSLDLIRYPTDEQVRAYRHRLGIQRRGTKLGKHGFWTPLIGWTMRQLRGRLSERDACEATARLLHHAWPRVHANDPATVKSRYYSTL